MGEDKKISPQLAYYHRKRQDPAFWDKELKRLNENNKKRYHECEEARNRIKEQARERYYRLKAALQEEK